MYNILMRMQQQIFDRAAAPKKHNSSFWKIGTEAKKPGTKRFENLADLPVNPFLWSDVLLLLIPPLKLTLLLLRLKRYNLSTLGKK